MIDENPENDWQDEAHTLVQEFGRVYQEQQQFEENENDENTIDEDDFEENKDKENTIDGDESGFHLAMKLRSHYDVVAEYERQGNELRVRIVTLCMANTSWTSQPQAFIKALNNLLEPLQGPLETVFKAGVPEAMIERIQGDDLISHGFQEYYAGIGEVQKKLFEVLQS